MDAVLLHCITITNCDGTIFGGLTINGETIWRSNLVLAGVTLTDILFDI